MILISKKKKKDIQTGISISLIYPNMHNENDIKKYTSQKYFIIWSFRIGKVKSMAVTKSLVARETDGSRNFRVRKCSVSWCCIISKLLWMNVLRSEPVTGFNDTQKKKEDGEVQDAVQTFYLLVLFFIRINSASPLLQVIFEIQILPYLYNSCLIQQVFL